jgi:hypothetical protein
MPIGHVTGRAVDATAPTRSPRAAQRLAHLAVHLVDERDDRRVAQPATSSSLIVCASTPFAASITITAASTAVSTRYGVLEKSWWPGVSSRLIVWPPYSNCITELVTEIPRCFSTSIQSDVAWRELLRALTVPAIWIAPP